ncbi:MAG: SDR family NAD(P)-dependent oxidoreductase [Candidatus Aminicenantes bacterium]|jgi:acyl transferase domain-containing protein/acyl carrier protein/SAM-dependent methyltransferase/short-subunit dehydrogenase
MKGEQVKKNPENNAGDVPARIQAAIIAELARGLNVPGESIAITATFLELGVNSVLGVDLIEGLNKELGIELGVEVIFDYKTPGELARYIMDRYYSGGSPGGGSEVSVVDVAAAAGDVTPGQREGDIAIIGAAGRLPGARNIEEYWTNLEKGRCSIHEIQRPGWNASDYYDPDPAKENKSISKWAGLVEDIDCFDPLFFNISPREALYMDPQQRLFLEEAYKAFENSGYTMEQLSGQKVGVFVGGRSMNYEAETLRCKPINPQGFLGNDMSILAARISYYMNLKGPNLVVDTACSSSLVALHLACESIKRGESHLALAGGVFLMPSPDFLVKNSKTEMLSPDGRCKTFDDSANGIVIGEGVGALVLKSLEQALRDGDYIYGVIKGSGLNQDGATKGITAPSSLSQKELIRHVYEKSGIHPGTVSFIEAHGTGTKLGDPIEVTALTEAFRAFTDKKQFCAIGSHKPNIGHTIVTAGTAGVFKILMAFKYKKIPPTICLEKLNRHINFEDSPFFVNTTLLNWERKNSTPRRAGISSFGFSGTNCHLVLEEPPRLPDQKPVTRPYYLIPLSAKTQEALGQKIRDLKAWSDQEGRKHPIADTSYTLVVGRSHFALRTAWVVKDIPDLEEKLNHTETAGLNREDNPIPPVKTKFRQEHLLKEFGNMLLEELNRVDNPDEKYYESRLLALADLYVMGADLDWKKLYQPRARRSCFHRISLPLYPFTRQSYWITGVDQTRYRQNERDNPGVSFDREDFLYLPSWKPRPLSPDHLLSTSPIPSKGKILVLYSSYSSRGMELKDALVNAHVSAGDEVLEQELDATPGEWTRQLRPDEGIPVIYFLGGGREQDRDMTDLEVLARASQYGALSLFRLVKSLGKQGLLRKPLVLKVITNRTAAVIPGEPINPWAASMPGLVKTMMREYPCWTISCIDVGLPGKKASSREMAVLVKQLLEEPGKAGPGEAPEIAFRDGYRYVRTLEPVKLPEVPAGRRLFKERGVYLIVGGGGGIGLELSLYLAKTVRARLVLLGRSELNEEQKQKIAGIEASGGKVLYIRADITGAASMEQAAARAKSAFGIINGAFHSAMVYDNQLLEHMDEQIFTRVMAPKVKGSVIFHRVLKNEPLDFMVFFSSCQSFLGDAGCGNYGAGCTFKDTYALYLDQEKAYPVKVINWGYWQGVSGALDEERNAFLVQRGLRANSSEEGLEALERLLNSRVPQVLAIKAEKKVLDRLDIHAQQGLELLPEKIPPIDGNAFDSRKQSLIEQQQRVTIEGYFSELERLSHCLLLAAFQRMGVFRSTGERYDREQLEKQLKIIPLYSRLLEALLDILARAGFIRVINENGRKEVVTGSINPGLQKELAELGNKKNHLAASIPVVNAYVNVLWVCLEKYPEILRGDLPAGEVLFPNSSLELLEKIYKGNEMADHYNELVAWGLVSYVNARLPRLKEKIKILEVGAGTGGTSAQLFDALRDYQDRLHYVYTDISLAFTRYGQEQYGGKNPFVEFKVLDLEKDVEKQGFSPGDFDVVIATNVLHATRCIRKTLENIKMLLKTNGWLMVNDLTRVIDIITLIFGLTEGWWLYEDRELRLPFSPLLGPGTWSRVLKEQGFEKVWVWGEDNPRGKSIQQHVLAAESNGLSRRRTGEIEAVKAAAVTITPLLKVPVPGPARTNTQPGEAVPPPNNIQGYVEEKIQDILVSVLQIDKNACHLDSPYSDFGVDSILAIDIILKINEELGIELRSTDLFNYSTIKKLSGYIVKEFDLSRCNDNRPGVCAGGPAAEAGLAAAPRETPPVPGAQPPGENNRVNSTGQQMPPDVEAVVLECFASGLGVGKDEIDPGSFAGDLGIDTILANDIANRINDELGTVLKAADLFLFSTAGALAGHIAREKASAVGLLDREPGTSAASDPGINAEGGEPVGSRTEAGSLEIAVIGLSGRFPDADNVGEFWQNLAAGKNSIREITRWDVSRFYDPQPHKPGKSHNKWGAFLSDIEMFDPRFFNISPKEAELMDPQQRLFLQEAYKALEDAGYGEKELDGKKCGIFVGYNASDYSSILLASQHYPEAYGFTGNHEAILSARLAYFLNLKGPAVTVNTACSASLSSVHLACESIRTGSSEMVVAGGVMVMATPWLYLQTSTTTMLSTGSQCKAFDDAADGFVPGEAVGAVVLKPLAAARRDRDHIYAVIVGSGINQDGKTSGITAPNGPAQTALECEIYDRFNIEPGKIGYIETHGTGTSLGDPIEMDALTDAFRRYTSQKQFCAVGSVKTNVGHTLAASGITSLIKVLLCLKHKQLVPSLNFEKENRHIHFQDTPFYVNTHLRDWLCPAREPRMAAVSAFGFSGTNAHMVIREADSSFSSPGHKALKPFYLLPVSAKTAAVLGQKLAELGSWLENNGEKHLLKDISFTLMKGRSHFSHRWVLAAASSSNPSGLAASIRSSLDSKGNNKNPASFLTHVVNEDQFKPEPALQELGENLLRELQEQRLTQGDYQKKLMKLGDLFVKGYDLDWQRLYEGETCSRVSLPVYPFAREEYWVPGASRVPTGYTHPYQYESGEQAGSGFEPRHPLIDNIVFEQSLNQGIVFEKVLSGEELLLRDHQVRNEPIFPGVGYLEMAFAAGFRVSGGTCVGLSEVAWLEPLKIPVNSQSVRMRTMIKKDNKTGKIVYEIYSSHGAGDRGTLHSKGEIIPAADSRSNTVPQRFSLADIKAGCPVQLDRETIYSRIRAVGIVHGPYLQGLQRVRINQDATEALGWLRLPPGKEKELAVYSFHPCLLDSALQTLIGILTAGGTKLNRTLLPFTAARVEKIPPQQLGVSCYAYLKSLARDRFHVMILNENGELCIEVQDIVFRELKAGIGTGLMQDFFYVPRWIPESLSLSTAPVDSLPGKQRVLLVGSPGPVLANALVKAHERVGDEVTRWESGTGAGPVTVTGTDTGTGAVAGSSVQLEEFLRAQQAEDRLLIYFLGGLQEEDIGSSDWQALDRSQERGVFSLFRLFKRLSAHGLTQQSLRLKVLTNDVFAVGGNDCIKPYGASLHGLVKSMAGEYPQWGISCMDISFCAGGDQGMLDTLVKQVTLEPPHPRGETVVFREGKRFVRIIEPALIPGENPGPFKRQGVYLLLGGAGGIGLELSLYLADNYQARLVLIGRKSFSHLLPDQKKKISQARVSGGEVLYLQADAADPVSMKAAVQEARSRFGRIDGVIHMAIVLNDQPLEYMEEETLRAVLVPKVWGSVILPWLFEGQEPDFMIFFSSAQSFIGNAGQGNYAAASTFEDAFAYYLSTKESYAVRIINWGFWGNAGIAAAEGYHQRLAALGVGTIDTREGIEALERIMGVELIRVMPIKAQAQLLEKLGIDWQRRVQFYPRSRGPVLEAVVARVREELARDPDGAELPGIYDKGDVLGKRLLLRSFQEIGVLRQGGQQYHKKELLQRLGIIPAYSRLFDALLEILVNAGFIEVNDQVIIGTQVLDSPGLRAELEQLEADRERLAKKMPEIQPHLRLLWACVSAYPRVLTGGQSHMEVMFPEGDRSLVENVYRGNKITDFYNRLAARVVRNFIDERLCGPGGGADRVRILEVGAGTGGTSAFVFEEINSYAKQIQYYYTDISSGFTGYAREKFGERYDFVEFKVLDIERSPLAQGFEPGSIDLVLGSNVLHATRRMDCTLNHVKQLLKTNGVLVINEITRVWDFATLTYGLTDGWWLYEDGDLRMKDSPLLSVLQWRRVLAENGFKSINVLGIGKEAGKKEEGLDQAVIAAESNGGTVVTENFDLMASREIVNPPVNADDTNVLDELPEITKYLKRVFARVLKIDESEIDSRSGFGRYGVDSLVVLDINRELGKTFSNLPNTLLFEYNSIESLANYFLKNRFPELSGVPGFSINRMVKPDPAAPIKSFCGGPGGGFLEKSPLAAAVEDREIAIIGITGRYPQSPTLKEFWRNLQGGRSCINRIPQDRWQGKGWKVNKFGWGGFISDVDKFDPLFFNISPKEAEGIDPQERLFLESVWTLLESAGVTSRVLQELDQRVGVFVGVMNRDYEWLGAEELARGSEPVGQSSYSSIANRVSYFFNLQGPSMAVDTACSSSLTALHLACKSLNRGESYLAIAGGVNLILHPAHLGVLAARNLLSDDDKCRSFGAGANGFLVGEGVGVVLLKPLARAAADGDRIYGVIKATGIRAGGRSSGYMVPNPNAQADLVLEALERAQVNARTISYIEAQAVGSPMGDPIEIAGLMKAFRQYTTDKQFCAIGSVKSNIGHLESASGMAGLTRVLLQMRYKQLAPSLHAEKLNPDIDFENSPFYVQRELSGWKQPEIVDNGVLKKYPRRAGISSFGAGGAISHVIIEEAPQTADNDSSSVRAQPINRFSPTAKGPYLIILSAKKEERLAVYARDILAFLEEQGDHISLPDMAYTLQVGREALPERLALLVHDIEELREKLGAFCGENPGLEGDSVFRGSIKKDRARVRDLVDGEEGKEFLRIIINKQKLGKLAELWVSGIDIDWGFLYGDRGVMHLLDLPGYPFSRERYWLPGAVLCPVDNQGVERLHPLLGVNTSDFKVQRFTTRLTGDEFFLADHVVAGQKVLPGVTYLEMARAAGEMASGEKVGKIKNMTWIKPITLPGSGDGHPGVHIGLYPDVEADNRVVEYEIYTGSPEGYCQGEGQEVHARGKLVYGNGFEDPDLVMDRIDIDAVKKRCSHIMEGRECYQRFLEAGFSYGPAFQSIVELHSSDTEALAWLKLPGGVTDSLGEYVLHPSLLDGALQTVTGLMEGRGVDRSAPYIPFSVNEVEILKSLGETCYVYAVQCGDKTPGKGLKSFDIQLLNEAGEPGVRLLGYTSLLFNPAKVFTSGNEVLEEGAAAVVDDEAPGELAREMYFHPVWQECPLDSGTGLAGPGKAGQVLLLDFDRELWGLMSGNGDRVILVTPGEDFRELSQGIYELNPRTEKDYYRLVEVLKEQNRQPGKIIYKWSWSGSVQGVDGIYPLFYLTRALMQWKSNEQVRLLYLYPGSNDEVRAFHGAVSAFARTLFRENARFIYRVVELRNLPGVPGEKSIDWERVLERLYGEFQVVEDDHFQVGYDFSDGKRRVKKFKEVDLAGVDHTGSGLFKEKGVYLITGGIGGLGLIFARFLARQLKVGLVLVDRCEYSGLSAEKRNKLVELEDLGAEVLYINSDISSLEQGQEVIRQVKSRFKQINGVFHCAGVTRDGFLLKKTRADLEEVLAPKLVGTKVLDEVTRDEPLDFFVLFSSIVSVLGNIGQADYAFANSYMDHFAWQREQWREQGKRCGKTLAVNWPLWKEGGMQVSEQAKSWWEKSLGIAVMETTAGLEAFAVAMALHEPQVIVIAGIPAKVRELLGVCPAGDSVTKAHEPGEPGKTGSSREEVEKDLKRLCMELLKVKETDIDIEDELSEYGVDSIMMITILNRLEEMYGQVVEPDVLVEHKTIKSLAGYIIKNKVSSQKFAEKTKFHKVLVKSKVPGSINEKFLRGGPGGAVFSKSAPPGRRRQNNKIAIIGMACRFPRSGSLERYWDNLTNGRHLVTEVPADRWDISQYYSPDKNAKNKTYSKWGGFIDGIYAFAASYFGIGDEDALVMDPQHRILLELTEELFSRAGYTREELSNSRTGVYIGGGESTYNRKDIDEIPGDYLKHLVVNTIPNMMAARVSDFYNLKGVSQTMDTACSSSLLSIHRACSDLLSGECDMAVAGGIELLVGPFFHIAFSKAGILSDDGISYVFDERANGFVPAEGAGLVLLKPYEAALRDGDDISGIICGSAVNNDGHTMGLTVPNMEGQKEVIQLALDNSGVSPVGISYLETHGTGTLLGDPIEIKAATQVYRKFTREKQYCGVGSVKSNMGHLGRAAGVAGFIKVILALQNRVIPPTLHCERPHPRFQFQDSPFYPVCRLKEWQLRGTGVRRAGISAFGFGGTNCHMILEEFAGQGERGYIKKRKPLSLPVFKRKYYCLGQEIAAVDPGPGKDFDAIGLMKVLEDLRAGKIDWQKAFALINPPSTFASGGSGPFS